MRRSSLSFILIFTSTLSANAAVFRCEKLFLTDKDFRQMAVSLAAFRAEATATKDLFEKSTRLKDVDLKLEEFHKLVGDASEANKLFVTAVQERYLESKRKKIDTRSVEKENRAQLQEEQKKILEWTAFKEFKNYHDGIKRKALVTPDGTKLVTVGSSSVNILDLRTMKSAKLPMHLDQISQSILSPDGSKLIVASKNGFVLTFIDLNTLLEIPHKFQISRFNNVTGFAITPDGSELIVSYYQEGIKRLNLKTMEDTILLQGSADSVQNQMAVTPDGFHLITANEDGKVWMFNLRSNGLPILLYQHAKSVKNIAISADGKYLTTAGGDGAMLFNFATKDLYSIPNRNGVVSSIFTSDSSKLITLGLSGDVKVTDVALLKEIGSQKHFPFAHDAIITPDGSMLVTTSVHAEIKFSNLDGDDFQILPLNSKGQTYNPRYVSVTPDGRKIIAIDNDGTMFIVFQDFDEAEKFKNAP